MIQDFTVKGGPAFGRENLPKLRAKLETAGLDGFIVPHEDEYQNEYLPESTDRLGWLSGFTGSAGAAIAMKDRAVILVDGRYTLQVREQVDGELFDYADLVAQGVPGWLAENGKSGEKVGYDPKLVSPDALARWQKGAVKSGVELVALSDNPIDGAWVGRPAAPSAKIHPHDTRFSGVAHQKKIARIADELKEQGADATILTSPASIAWAMNLRGGDVACTPLPLSTAIVRTDGSATLYVNPDKMTQGALDHLGNSVAVEPEENLVAGISGLSGQSVSLDPSLASAWYFEQVEAAGGTVVRAQDPVALPRACKNEVEVEGARRAHRRDGIAISRFLHWLDSKEVQAGNVDEIEAASKLEHFRHETGALQDLSFESISGAGPDGAIVHYRVNKDSNRAFSQNSLYLIDSGGQYIDGTTDITRTVAIGTPTDEMCDRFTRVLKGHIALSRIRFPEGTTGTHLDTLARMVLWEAGLDYEHGTGHGVGSYLGVHEGPQRIAKGWNATALQPGMIVSNEPGYYKAGEYGIRIENLQVVTPAEDIEGGEKPMMGFETLTLAPINRRLIAKDLLNSVEVEWVNAYHARVCEVQKPYLHGQDLTWLKAACAPL